ncbi:MAG: GNAT family N-acetyltransferase [Acidithiobacillus sp.]
MGMAEPDIRGFTNLQVITQPKTPACPAQSGTIREAGPGDLDALVAIENQCFPVDRISRPGFRRFLSQNLAHSPQGCDVTHRRSRTLVVEQDSGVCGYATILLRRNSLTTRIYSLAIAPEHRRMGMARTLLAGAESVAVESGRNRIRLEAREDNAAAIRLYTSVGYRSFDRIEQYYEDRTAAIRMEKPL